MAPEPEAAAQLQALADLIESMLAPNKTLVTLMTQALEFYAPLAQARLR